MTDTKHAVATSTSATITSGVRSSLSLEKCTGGKDYEEAIIGTFQANPPGYLSFAGSIPGSAVVRLWSSPDLSPSLHVANSFADREYVSLGAREEKVFEVLTFNNSAEASLSKSYSASGVKVLASTPFYGGSQPSYFNGSFRADKPVTGALVVEYTATYRAYRVYYSLPEWAAQKLFNQNQALESLSLPPVFVFAIADGHSASTQIERKVTKVSPPDCKDDEWVTDPAESEIVKYKIYADKDMTKDTPRMPKPNADYLTAVAYTKHVQFCKNRVNRRKTSTYPTPKADNIEIISTGHGWV